MFRVPVTLFLLGLGAASVLLSQSGPAGPPISILKGIPKGQPNPLNTTSQCREYAGLTCALPNLYGPYGLVLPNPTHAAHFNSTFQTNFSALNSAIATQLTLLPLTSPASGFTYQFDESTGVYTRSAETFGPVLTERAETIGRHKLYLGASLQRFRFDKIDGIPLHNLPVVFSHQENTGPASAAEPFETQFISTDNSLDLKINQFTFFANYGLTDHFDISIAIPLLEVGFNATSYATINRTAHTEPLGFVNGQFVLCCSDGPPFAHFFDPNDRQGSLKHTFSNNPSARRAPALDPNTDGLYSNPSKNTASGLGDIVFRFKAGVLRSDRMSLALLTDLRIPTGDERNFLGSGAYGVKPFVALSARAGKLTPHFNVGYQWNGSSLLSGNITTGSKDTLPGFAFFSAGTDVGVWRRLTLAADYLGQELINAPTVSRSTFTSVLPLATTGQTGTFATIQESKRTYNQSSAAFGFKYNLFGQLLLTGNLLVALNDGGLRERVVPLVGLSYAF
jgi:hypothetical protein